MFRLPCDPPFQEKYLDHHHTPAGQPAEIRSSPGPAGPRGSGLKITFETDAAGIRVQAATENAAVEYQAAGEFPNERLCAPFDLLADVEACKDDRVELETTGDGRVLARWQDRGIPQTTQYQVAEGPATSFPAFPTSIKANPPRLLAALHDAMESTDDGAVRFATNCVQLRSDGSLVGTDGRQVLVQNGFEFPWKEDLLVARNSVFGSKELRSDQPVDIGNTDDWLSLRAGSWVLHFRLNKEGRFPKVADVIPSADTATTMLRLFPADRDFLAQALKRLPCNDALNQPITVDLNGAVAIRAQPEDGRQVTELLLTGSERVGPPVCFNTNRKFLARALALGFQEILVFDPKAPSCAATTTGVSCGRYLIRRWHQAQQGRIPHRVAWPKRGRLTSHT